MSEKFRSFQGIFLLTRSCFFPFFFRADIPQPRTGIGLGTGVNELVFENVKRFAESLTRHFFPQNAIIRMWIKNLSTFATTAYGQIRTSATFSFNLNVYAKPFSIFFSDNRKKR